MNNLMQQVKSNWNIHTKSKQHWEMIKLKIQQKIRTWTV